MPVLPDQGDPTGQPAPAWLAERRRLAASAVEAEPMPSTADEVWRYSRVDEVDLARYPVADAGGGPVPAGVHQVLAAVPERAATVVAHNGHVVLVEVAPRWADAGLEVRRLAADGAEGDEQRLGAVSGEGADLFVRLNDAQAPDPVVVRAPRGLAVDQPVLVVDWVDVDAGSSLFRLVVRLEADAELTVLEWQGGDGDGDALAIPVVELDVDRAARLRHAQVQDRGRGTWQFGSVVARVEADATATVVQAALGGRYARSRVDCHLAGRGSSGNLGALYAAEDDQTLDFRTFQHHEAPDTSSNLLFKGALDGDSRSVYTGTIRIDKVARRANAFQTNRNLKLSDGAWAESVPNLEIENNDVRCSHASTVGPIDPDQRFYLESRGVPTDTAERLVVAGFFDEVLQTLPSPGMAQLVRDQLDRRLRRREALLASQAEEDS